MTTDLFSTLVSVVNRPELFPLPEQDRAAIVDQIWRHASTNMQDDQTRAWVAASSAITGQTRAQVLASSEDTVRLRAVTNPVLTESERLSLLSGRGGLRLLREALVRTNEPDVLTCLYREALRRWPKAAAGTRTRLTRPLCQSLELAHWLAHEHPDADTRDRLGSVLPHVARLILPHALTAAQKSHDPGAPWIPAYAGVALSLVSDDDLHDALEQTPADATPSIRLWATLALRRPMPAPLVELILRRITSQDDWTAQMFTDAKACVLKGSTVTYLHKWRQHAIDHPHLVFDIAADAVNGREGVFWAGIANIAADTLRGDPRTVSVDVLGRRFGMLPGTDDPAVTRAIALRDDTPMTWRWNAWAVWHETDPDTAVKAAEHAERLPELLAALARQRHSTDDLAGILDTRLANPNERAATAAAAVALLLEHAPGQNDPLTSLIPLAGTDVLLILPWDYVRSVTVSRATVTAAGTSLVTLLLTTLTGPEDWELCARLAENWHGTLGDLLNAVEALRTP